MIRNLMHTPDGVRAKPGIELIAGTTTFLTMAYIIFVNAQILSVTGMDKNALIAVTCLVSGVATILTGILARAPIAMAPGMGLNAFFAYTLVLGDGIPWPVALGIVFLSGLVFLLLTWVGLRRRLVEAIPPSLLHAIAVGIGVFIAFIGMQNLGLVVRSDATMVAAGKLNATVLIGLTGLLVMVLCELFRVRGALLIGIFTATVISVATGLTSLPERVISLHIDFSPLFGRLDILGALKVSFLAPIFTLMFMDLFDSIGTLLACTQEAEMVKPDGSIPMLGRMLYLDAGATMFGAVAGTSTTTSYIESASGIAAGGRSGMTAVVTGGWFLLALVFIPILTIVPAHATAPALIMVGFTMIKNLLKIDFSEFETAFPSFLIIIMIALSYSISTGLAFGFLTYTLLKVVRGKTAAIKPALWIINILCLLFFLI